MADDRLPVVVFGATGFTGKIILQELLRCAPKSVHSIGVAGRDKIRLDQLAGGVRGYAGIKVISGVDVTNYSSVVSMAEQTRLIINVVGPYRLYGEPVVKACVEAGTDYVDVCGEPGTARVVAFAALEFMENMELLYGARAKEKGVYLTSGAGFESLTLDVGTLFAQRLYQPPAVPSLVEAFVTCHPGPDGYTLNYTTWRTAVLAFAGRKNLKKIRREAARTLGRLDSSHIAGPKPHVPFGKRWDKRVRAWTLPFIGSCASVVRRTQKSLSTDGQPAVHFVARMTLASSFYANLVMAYGALFKMMSTNQLGRWFLLRFPGAFSYGLFSHKPPTQEQIEQSTFEVLLVSHGYSKGLPKDPSEKPDQEVSVRISGPDLGYIGTAKLVVQAAITMLEERGSLGAAGIHTPGVLLQSTTIIERLMLNGIQMEVKE